MKPRETIQMMTIAQANEITQEWIETHVDLNRAKAVFENRPNRSERQKLTRLEYQPEYDWMIDPTFGDVFVLVEVAVNEVEPSEKDWDRALKYETTRQYIEWFQEGHQSPPITVVQHVDGDLVSTNRRRWLAARAAGVETLKAWYSPTADSGRPRWELKPCTLDRDKICREYKQGKDCVSCADYEKEQPNERN